MERPVVAQLHGIRTNKKQQCKLNCYIKLVGHSSDEFWVRWRTNNVSWQRVPYWDWSYIKRVFVSVNWRGRESDQSREWPLYGHAQARRWGHSGGICWLDLHQFYKKYRDRISPPKTMLMLRDNAICRKVSWYVTGCYMSHDFRCEGC